jgi:hypothetical protein
MGHVGRMGWTGICRISTLKLVLVSRIAGIMLPSKCAVVRTVIGDWLEGRI